MDSQEDRTKYLLKSSLESFIILFKNNPTPFLMRNSCQFSR